MTAGCVVAWEDLKPILNDMKCPEETVGYWEQLCGENSLRIFIESENHIRCVRMLFREEDIQHFHSIDPTLGAYCADSWVTELRKTIARGQPV